MVAFCLAWCWATACTGYLRSINHYQTEVIITVAGVMGGYLLAQKLHISGPLAMVVAGLFVGDHARQEAMSRQTEEYIDKFWELIDSILNALLFVLIGLELLIIDFQSAYWIISYYHHSAGTYSAVYLDLASLQAGPALARPRRQCSADVDLGRFTGWTIHRDGSVHSKCIAPQRPTGHHHLRGGSILRYWAGVNDGTTHPTTLPVR